MLALRALDDTHGSLARILESWGSRRSALTIHHHVILVDGGIVDLNSLQVIMSGVIAVQHIRCQVRNILTRVTFAGEIDLAVLEAERLNEFLPEIVKLIRDIFLVFHRCRTRGVSSAGGLVDIDDIGEIGPGIRIWHGRMRARLPEKRAILLQQAIERAASGAPVQPDGNLYNR